MITKERIKKLEKLHGKDLENTKLTDEEKYFIQNQHQKQEITYDENKEKEIKENIKFWK